MLTNGSVIGAEYGVLNVKSTTWGRDSHELFDYESRHVHAKKFLVRCPAKVFRTDLEVSISGEGETLPRAPADYLVAIKKKDGKYYVSPADRALGAGPTPMIQPKKLWLIIKNLPTEKYSLQEFDIIKLGRFKLKVKQICTETTLRTPIEFRLDEGEIPVTDLTRAESATLQCRICLLEGGSDEDPLVRPCQCKGSIMYVHVDCLKHWVNGRLNLTEDSNRSCCFIKQLQCELCKTTLPSAVINGQTRIPIVEIPNMQPPLMILENLVGPSNRGFHVCSMASKKDCKLGRGHESDVRIADVSISRFHAMIHYGDGCFQLEDHHSKFGTLVALRKPVIVETGERGLSVQVGRTVLYFTTDNNNNALMAEGGPDVIELADAETSEPAAGNSTNNINNNNSGNPAALQQPVVQSLDQQQQQHYDNNSNSNNNSPPVQETGTISASPTYPPLGRFQQQPSVPPVQLPLGAPVINRSTSELTSSTYVQMNNNNNNIQQAGQQTFALQQPSQQYNMEYGVVGRSTLGLPPGDDASDIILANLQGIPGLFVDRRQNGGGDQQPQQQQQQFMGNGAENPSNEVYSGNGRTKFSREGAWLPSTEQFVTSDNGAVLMMHGTESGGISGILGGSQAPPGSSQASAYPETQPNGPLSHQIQQVLRNAGLSRLYRMPNWPQPDETSAAYAGNGGGDSRSPAAYTMSQQPQQQQEYLFDEVEPVPVLNPPGSTNYYYGVQNPSAATSPPPIATTSQSTYLPHHPHQQSRQQQQQQ